MNDKDMGCLAAITLAAFICLIVLLNDTKEQQKNKQTTSQVQTQKGK